MRFHRFRWGGWQLALPQVVLTRSDRLWWIRVRGYGLTFNAQNTFSDRNHAGCHIHVGRYVMRVLRPERREMTDGNEE